jgi:predicted nucleic acid-binding protein
VRPLFSPKDVDDLAAVYERLTATAASLGRFRILSFTKPAILRFELLCAAKLGVAKMDVRIAAVTLYHRVGIGSTSLKRERRPFARASGLYSRIVHGHFEVGGTVATRNSRDFQRVLGLAIKDWSV